MPKATIVVPAYNVATTLADTLASLCAQTFADFEIIVVTNPSEVNGLSNTLTGHEDPRSRTTGQKLHLIPKMQRRTYAPDPPGHVLFFEGEHGPFIGP